MIDAIDELNGQDNSSSKIDLLAILFFTERNKGSSKKLCQFQKWKGNNYFSFPKSCKLYLLVMGIFAKNIMYLISSTINFSLDCLFKSGSLQDQLKQKAQAHDYTQLVSGEGYVFELIDAGIRGYMTSSGKGVKPGEYILLGNDISSSQYQVEQIDYYSNPPDMWIALLKRAG